VAYIPHHHCLDAASREGDKVQLTYLEPRFKFTRGSFLLIELRLLVHVVAKGGAAVDVGMLLWLRLQVSMSMLGRLIWESGLLVLQLAMMVGRHGHRNVVQARMAVVVSATTAVTGAVIASDRSGCCSGCSQARCRC
jgi:hypothetical protein